jgi:hypothetical protein
MSFQIKYLKYKEKYLNLKKNIQAGGGQGLLNAVLNGDEKNVKSKLESRFGKSDPNTVEAPGGKSVLMISAQKYSETKNQKFYNIFFILLNNNANLFYITSSNEMVFNYIDDTLSDYLVQQLQYRNDLLDKLFNLNFVINDKFENFLKKLLKKNYNHVKSNNPKINDILYTIMKADKIDEIKFESIIKDPIIYEKEINYFLDIVYDKVKRGTLDVNEKIGGYLLLEYAVLMGNVELVKLLIEKGAVYKTDKPSQLYFDSYYPDYKEKSKQAHQIFVDELIKRKDNNSMLQLLSINGLNKNISCNVLNILINEPKLLEPSIYNRCESVTKILLEKGADYRLVNNGIGIINFLNRLNYSDEDYQMKEDVFRHMISKGDYRFLVNINSKKLFNKYLKLVIESPQLNVNSVQSDYTLLELAVKFENDKLVVELFNKGADASKIVKLHRFFTDIIEIDTLDILSNIINPVIQNLMEHKDYRFLQEFSKSYIIEYLEYKYTFLIGILDFYMKKIIETPGIDLNMLINNFSTMLGIAVTNNLKNRIIELLEKGADYNKLHNNQSILEYVFEGNYETQEIIFNYMLKNSDYKFIPKIRELDNQQGQQDLYYYLKMAIETTTTREGLLELYKYIQLLEDYNQKDQLRSFVNQRIKN